METLAFGFLFTVAVAYGVVGVADPIRSMRLDGTATRDDGEPGEAAVRNRRYAGGVIVVGGVLGAYNVAGVPGVAACVVGAALARVWVGAAGTGGETVG